MKKKLLICIVSVCLLCGATVGLFMMKSSIFDGNIEALTQNPDGGGSGPIQGTNTYSYWIDWSGNSAFQNVLEAVRIIPELSTVISVFEHTTYFKMALVGYIICQRFADAMNPQCMWINCCGPNGRSCDPDGEALASYKELCIQFEKGIYSKNN